MTQVLIKTNNVLPAYTTAGSAAMDLRAETAMSIAPGGRAMIHTGIHIKMPQGVAALVMPRSGLALKHGVTVANAPGLIDSDYTGEICVILQNHGDAYFDVSVGDRIAQLLFIHFDIVNFVKVDELPDTERGAGGFGSTGTT